MSAVTFDTDAIIQRMKEHGISEEHAREFVRSIVVAQSQLASKLDLEGVQHVLRNEISETGKSLQRWVIGLILPIYALQLGTLLAVFWRH